MQSIVNEFQFAALSFSGEARLAQELDPAWHVEFEELFDFYNASLSEILDLAARAPSGFMQGWVQAQAFNNYRPCV